MRSLTIIFPRSGVSYVLLSPESLHLDIVSVYRHKREHDANIREFRMPNSVRSILGGYRFRFTKIC